MLNVQPCKLDHLFPLGLVGGGVCTEQCCGVQVERGSNLGEVIGAGVGKGEMADVQRLELSDILL